MLYYILLFIYFVYLEKFCTFRKSSVYFTYILIVVHSLSYGKHFVAVQVLHLSAPVPT